MCACVCVCVVKPAVPTNFAYATKIWGCRSNINISVNVTLLFRVTRLLASSISIVFFAQYSPHGYESLALPSLSAHSSALTTPASQPASQMPPPHTARSYVASRSRLTKCERCFVCANFRRDDDDDAHICCFPFQFSLFLLIIFTFQQLTDLRAIRWTAASSS